jgi:acyl-CoA thioesterase
MAIDQGIVGFGQGPSPLVRGLGAVAEGVEAIRAGQVRANRQASAKALANAFSDESDDQMTTAFLNEAIERDPEFAFAQIQAMQGGTNVGTAEAEFNRLTSGLSPEEKAKAVKIKLGLSPRAQGSGALTIAQQGVTEDVAQSEAQIAAAREGAVVESKAKAKGKVAPIIAKAEATIQAEVQKEKESAKSKEKAKSELRSSKAALPSLRAVVETLKELAPFATSTLAGKAWNEAVKQLGFGSTKGATARAQFIAIIDNQVLPLLKQTFGAAFTVQEGENLKRTMGDPDASPEEKIAQLNAFIDNKVREIEVKEREIELGKEEEKPKPKQEQKPKQESPKETKKDVKTFTSKSGITFTVE